MILILILILVMINFIIFSKVKENTNLTIVKEKYYTLIDEIKKGNLPKKFNVLKNPFHITGYNRLSGYIGYNTNKGADIGLCLDGNPNDIFHVLLHELAHSTVDEYNHSEEFWNNFSELKDYCEKIGIYERITNKKKFCNKHIQDIK